MSENSKIQWTDDTYNPWRGCTKVSAGCKNCYAEKLITNRLAHLHYEAATSGNDRLTSKQFHATAGGHSTSGIRFWGEGSPRIRGADLNAPLRWNKKPWMCGCEGKDGSTALKPAASHCSVCGIEYHRRRVFSLSLGDWLDADVPIEWLAEFLDVLRLCENLDWLLVTKRPELFMERLNLVMARAHEDAFYSSNEASGKLGIWLDDWIVKNRPPQGVMVLTSVENQKAADERIPALLKIPAARRGLSCEPLLEAIDLQLWVNAPRNHRLVGTPELPAFSKIDWVIVGGESGPGASQCNVEWIRGVKDQCKSAGVPCFVKQLGANSISHVATVPDRKEWRKTKLVHDSTGLLDKKGGDITEWPKDLQVREFYK